MDSLAYSMGGKDDNAARKLSKLSEVDTAEIDAEWEVPESGVQLDESTNVDADVIEAWSSHVGHEIDQVLRQPIKFEHLFEPGDEVLPTLLDYIPQGLTIVSGRTSISRAEIQGFGKEKIAIDSYPGITNLKIEEGSLSVEDSLPKEDKLHEEDIPPEEDRVPSRDGVTTMVRKGENNKKTISVVMVHSNAKRDVNAAALVNGLTLSSAHYLATHPYIIHAKDVLDVAQKTMMHKDFKDIHTDENPAMMHVLIEKEDGDEDLYSLDVAKTTGKFHCLTINPKNQAYDFMRIDVTQDPYKKRIEQHGMSIDELQETYEEEAHEEKWLVKAGEIVLLATDEILQVLGGRKKLVTKVLQMLKEGRSFQEIENAFLVALRTRQYDNHEKYPDRSASIVLFRVP